jgi:hypothetical protein
MTFLVLPAFVLLLAVPLLLWLALRRREPARLEVGTLMIWRRVAARRAESSRHRRRLEPLLWLLLAAVVIGALGAARPALQAAAPAPRVAVFIERFGAGAREPALAETLQVARENAPDADLEWYIPATSKLPGMPDDAVMLTPGPIEAELAQFETRTAHADARMLVLCAPHPIAERLGRVLPRAGQRAGGVLHKATVRGNELLLRASRGPGLTMQNLRELNRSDAGADVLITSELAGDIGTVTDATGNELRVTRRPFVIGPGTDWTNSRHRALLAALRADAGESPDLWLGAEAQAPAIRINTGAAADVSEIEVSYEAGHALFADLPLGAFDWAAAGRLLGPEVAARPLVSAVRDGAPVGHFVMLDENAKVLLFAGDPFSDAPIADAALLLDNAIGVLTGERASQRARYRLEGELPGERAAHAAPFQPRGALELAARIEAPREFASWLLAVAAIVAAAAATITLRK